MALVPMRLCTARRPRNHTRAFSISALVSLSTLLAGGQGLVLVAVVGLVVEHDDLALAPAHQVAQHAVDDLALVLDEGVVLPLLPA